MQKYKIQLTPVDTFFFGGEKHDATLKANYFVRSNSYPQQTTLLGLLRYYLLLKNPAIFKNNKITDLEAANNLIGQHSFNYPGNINFGKIKSIRPLYLTKRNIKYFFAPADILFDVSNNFQLSRHNKLYNAKDFEEQTSCTWLFSEDEINTVALHDIIEDKTYTGNEKSENGSAGDDAFYVQVLKCFCTPEWAFNFEAELADGSGIEEELVFLPFGGEKSIFKMAITRISEFTSFNFPNKLPQRPAVHTISCLSDCFVNWQDIRECDFAVNNFVSFRNLQSATHTSNIYSLKKRDAGADASQVRSLRYNLLKRGSVLYFKDKENYCTAKKLIESNVATSIGFNHIMVKSVSNDNI